MHQSIAVLLVLSSVSFAEPTEYRYSGTVAARIRGADAAASKKFQLFAFAHEKQGERLIDFQVDELGSGAWPWPHRFGRMVLNADGRNTAATGIRLLHDYNGAQYPLPVRSPIFPDAAKLKAGARWETGKEQLQVVGTEQVGLQKCWLVEIRTRITLQERVWVSVDEPLVVKSERKVFMGQGDEFRLTLTLDKTESPEGERADRVARAFETLLALQASLGRRKDATRPELSETQLKQVGAVLDRLKAETTSTPLARLSSTIARDHAAQIQRDGQLSVLAGKQIGRTAPTPDLVGLNEKSIDRKTLDGKVVVLHFWSYAGEPLEEPYGQIGYLDFLYGKRKKLGVEVVGVAVNEELGNPALRSKAARSVRKLNAFMNLSYPIALDDGSILKQFGDPRSAGGQLPLWIVLDHEGKIVSYQAGFYTVRRNEGLADLDAIVAEQIKKRHAARKK